MKPNFALSLSFEGIRLLHRVAGGWHLIGEIAVDDPKMTDQLALLRQKAIQLDPGGFHTKLIIPEDQIKLVTIETAQTTIDDVRNALDGATPYPLDELVIDFDRTGGRTHIAAVARETLEEAEAFANEHKFAPVAFVSEAEPFTFRGEVFFGATSVAGTILKDRQPERDEEPMRIIGSAVLSEPDLESEPLETVEDAASDNVDDIADASAEEEIAAFDEVDDQSDIADTDDAPEIDEQDDPEEVFEEPLFGTRRDQPVTAPSAAPAVGPAVASETPVLEKTITAPAVAPARTDSDAAFSSRRTDGEEQREAAVASIAAPKQRGRPRFLGLMLTAALLLFLLLVALWAGTISDEGLAGWFGSDEVPAEELVAAPEPTADDAVIETSDVAEIEPAAIEEQPALDEVTTVAVAPQEEAAPLAAQENENGVLPVLRQPVGRVLSPAEADRIYAATGVYQRAPRLPLTPRASTLDGFETAVSLPNAEELAAISLPDRDLMSPDADIVAPANPPAAGITFTRDLRGFILATPEGTVTPDGAIVFAGEPPKKPPFRPGTDVPEVEIERPLTGGNAALVLVAGRPPKIPPLRPEGLAPLPEVAAEIAASDSNILEQSDGLIVLAGAPLKLPPARPADFVAPPTPAEEDGEPDVATDADADPDAEIESEVGTNIDSDVAQQAEDNQDESAVAEEAIGIVVNPDDAVTSFGASLAGYRPALRPDGLVPEQAVDILALADPSLAGYRVKIRPASITANAVAATAAEIQDINDVIAALTEAAPDIPTAQAVAVSTRPDTRPRNFATVVASARPTPSTPNVSAAPAIASGPIPGGVARAATVENAIRLRDVNLIGVFGRGDNRRALVRLGNGRFVRVQVGSDLDGGKVTAIGDSALNYVRSGRTYALEIPSG